MLVTHYVARLALAAGIVVAAFGAARAESARSAGQLEQLVAPVALYPDALLAHVLMASTYPLEVAEAARWSQANPGVTAEELAEAMHAQSWDPSVKALTAVPLTLQMMNDKPEWVRRLGDAFLARQAEVLDAIQRLRTRADAAGNLDSTPQQRISRVAAPNSTGASATTVYVIEAPNPNEYHLPVYDPRVVYGRWEHPEDPPFTWRPPGHAAGEVISFAPGVGVGWAIWGRIDWWQNRLNVDLNRYNNFNQSKITRRAWAHDPAHRGNVPYPQGYVATPEGKPGAKDAERETAGKSAASSGKKAASRESVRVKKIARAKPAGTARRASR
jgi:Protein of unknown function (DUF3300)